MKEFLHHFLFPRESNNHRPKILHHYSLLITIALLLIIQFEFVSLKKQFPSVLGDTASVIVSDLLSLTNADRSENGLSTLTINDQLSNAASLKASDMFTKNYWAHQAPDGTTPWYFIKRAGYTYVYAGENLARGFDRSSDIVAAWMASPSHRENMLSHNYQDIGFAIQGGKLLGENTILVVEMFGTRVLPAVANAAPPAPTPKIQNPSNSAGTVLSENQLSEGGVSLVAKPLIDSGTLAFRISIFLLLFFISILFIDIVAIRHKKVVRMAGHNIDHILFFAMLVVIIVILGGGIIL